MDVDHSETKDKFLGKKRNRDGSPISEPPTERIATEKKEKDKYVCVSDLNRQES